MDAKNYIKNKSFCPLPWTGFIVHQNGDVRNCVLSKSKIGNLKDNSIQEIVSGEKIKRSNGRCYQTPNPATARAATDWRRIKTVLTS